MRGEPLARKRLAWVQERGATVGPVWPVGWEVCWKDAAGAKFRAYDCRTAGHAIDAAMHMEPLNDRDRE